MKGIILAGGSGTRLYPEDVNFVKDRAGHDRRYAIDASKIEKELGCKAVQDFESGILRKIRLA